MDVVYFLVENFTFTQKFRVETTIQVQFQQIVIVILVLCNELERDIVHEGPSVAERIR